MNPVVDGLVEGFVQVTVGLRRDEQAPLRAEIGAADEDDLDLDRKSVV